MSAPSEMPSEMPTTTDEAERPAVSGGEGEGVQPQAETRDRATIQKIQGLLKTKDDTSRFVGLALLKSVLDNTSALRDDEDALVELWEAIPAGFLRRLLRKGLNPGRAQGDAKNMLDIAVSVLHTFAALLPVERKKGEAFLSTIPLLVTSIVPSSEETTRLTLQTLATLVSQSEGAAVFTDVDDVTPLTEIAPSHPLVLDIFSLAWLASGAELDYEGRRKLRQKADETVRMLVAAFRGTDGVTLIAFLSSLLRQLQDDPSADSPRWLKPVVAVIHELVSSRPNPAAREAYMNLSATLLQMYPRDAPDLLFTDRPTAAKPSAYLLITLILVDLRSSLPTLLSQLNSPSYPRLSIRLTSAFDILSSFIGHLVASDGPPPISVDHLLKLRNAIPPALSTAMEHLRDRYDASTAGAPGLHPDARPGPIHPDDPTAPPRLAIAWDAALPAHALSSDPLVLAALRAAALWLRDDDDAALRAEATGLMDLLLALYPAAGPPFQDAVLVALAGLVPPPADEPLSQYHRLGPAAAEADFDDDLAATSGAQEFLAHAGWAVLAADILATLRAPPSPAGDPAAARRGTDAVRVLLRIVEGPDAAACRAEQLAFAGAVAAWTVPAAGAGGGEGDAGRDDFVIAVLQLATGILEGVPGGAVRRRYGREVGALVGVAREVRRMRGGEMEGEQIEDLVGIVESLEALR